jgi:hypothetical protein
MKATAPFDLLFHGTNRRHSELGVSHGRRNHPDGLGLWLTEEEATALDFAKRKPGEPTLFTVRFKAGTPFVVSSFAELEDLLANHGRNAERARQALLDEGYDFIVIDRSHIGLPDTARDFVALTPSILEVIDCRPVLPNPAPGM